MTSLSVYNKKNILFHVALFCTRILWIWSEKVIIFTFTKITFEARPSGSSWRLKPVAIRVMLTCISNISNKETNYFHYAKLIFLVKWRAAKNISGFDIVLNKWSCHVYSNCMWLKLQCSLWHHESQKKKQEKKKWDCQPKEYVFASMLWIDWRTYTVQKNLGHYLFL